MDLLYGNRYKKIIQDFDALEELLALRETVIEDGVTKTFLYGKLHSFQGPAWKQEGREEWYREGVHHRTDGPAIIINTNIMTRKEWFQNGTRHRENGPAIVVCRPWGQDQFEPDFEWFEEPLEQAMSFESQEWFQHGKRHAENHPAVLSTYNGKEYWIQGTLHREDGPAIVRPNGWTMWFKEGVETGAHLDRNVEFSRKQDTIQT